MLACTSLQDVNSWQEGLSKLLLQWPALLMWLMSLHLWQCAMYEEMEKQSHNLPLQCTPFHMTFSFLWDCSPYSRDNFLYCLDSSKPSQQPQWCDYLNGHRSLTGPAGNCQGSIDPWSAIFNDFLFQQTKVHLLFVRAFNDLNDH